MKILITGGIGFIGTNCALYFGKKNKNKITIIDNYSRHGVEKNSQYLKKHLTGINIINSDINNIDKYINYIKTADLVLHLAGQTAVTTSIIKPDLDFYSNLIGSFKILEAIRKNNPKAIVIYSSSNKVYGELNHHKIKKNIKRKRNIDICHPQGIDENEKLDFISPYGCSKGAVDLYFQDYHRIYNLRTIVFRQSCIYGPFQIGIEDQGWIAHFTKQIINNLPITIFGNGYQVRDLLYIDDLIKAYQLAIDNINKTKGHVFNIGGGEKNAYSLLEVTKIICSNTGNKIKTNYKKARLGDQQFFVSNNKKAGVVFNWQPETDFKQGINQLIKWQKNNL